VALFLFVAILGVAVGAIWFRVTQPFVGVDSAGGRDGQSATTIDPARLQKHVRVLSVEIVPRDFEHPVGLDQAAAYIREQLIVAGLSPTEQAYQIDGTTYRNVLVTLGRASAPVVVVGAHYDVAGPLPGADDNASGVAVLLELARLLAAAPPSATRVELVFFTLEEEGFQAGNMGSAVHAASLKAEGAKVIAMFSLEMLGCFNDTPDSQGFPFGILKLVYPTTGNFITVVGHWKQPGLVRTVKRAMRSASDLPVYSINAPSFVRGIDFSDHRSYWQQGFPAVMITDTAFYRNPRYHTPYDTHDTLDYARMAEVGRGIYAAVHALGR
jgi:Zn-dependent M28 family amino/carboxypeptidase